MCRCRKHCPKSQVLCALVSHSGRPAMNSIPASRFRIYRKLVPLTRNARQGETIYARWAGHDTIRCDPGVASRPREMTEAVIVDVLDLNAFALSGTTAADRFDWRSILGRQSIPGSGRPICRPWRDRPCTGRRRGEPSQGGAGNDTCAGDCGSDTFAGGDGDDLSIDGGARLNVFRAGDDTLRLVGGCLAQPPGAECSGLCRAAGPCGHRSRRDDMGRPDRPVGGAIVSHTPRIDFGIGHDPGIAGGGRFWSRRRWQPYAPRRIWV